MAPVQSVILSDGELDLDGNKKYLVVVRASHFFILRTEVRRDFNIHGTKFFQDAVFHQKSKNYDVLSLLYLWWAKKPVLSMNY